jgi:serine protease Do
MPPRSRTLASAFAPAAALAGALAAWCCAGAPVFAQAGPAVPPATRSDSSIARSLSGTPPGVFGPFVGVAERVLPAVVSVDVRRFFQHPPIAPDSTDEQELPDGPGNGMEIPSSGSGFIFDRRGYILTNSHVVEDAVEILVHLPDRRQFPATLVGADAATDIAVLRIEADGRLPVVPLGDSDALRTGEWVAAVGNPLGILEGSLTVGVVSGKARTEISIGGNTPAYQDFIQTDAAINFGNSGGPLVNTQGEAVGVNTAFGGPGRGLAFAISINMAREVAESLIREGRVARSFLGVILQRVDPMLAEALDLPDTHAALVREVEGETPAAQAGILPGDALVRFDGTRVEDMASFRLVVAKTPTGRPVPVRVVRKGKPVDLTVTLADRPEPEQALAEDASPAGAIAEVGLELAEVSDEERSPDPDIPRGALVVEVRPGSLASLAGFLADDIVLEIRGVQVGGPDQCRRLLRLAEGTGHPALVQVLRGGERWFLALPFAGKPGR